MRKHTGIARACMLFLLLCLCLSAGAVNAHAISDGSPVLREELSGEKAAADDSAASGTEEAAGENEVSAISPAEEETADTEDSDASRAETGQDGSVIQNVLKWIGRNAYILMAGVLIVLALVIIIVVIIANKKNREETEGEIAFRAPDDRASRRPAEPGPQDFSQEPASPFAWQEEKTLADVPVRAGYPAGNEDTIYDLRSSEPLLQLLVTFEGQTILVERRLGSAEIVLGRGESCDVDVTLGSTSDGRLVTSRRHTVIRYRADGLFAENLNPRNTTFINGQPIEGEVRLCNNDIIAMGRASAQVELVMI